MIAYVKGEITYKNPAELIIEAGGIGYRIHISLYTYTRIEKLERVKLLTYFHVKEDGQTLYGFSNGIERSLFIHLISVSGIGPNTARLILSAMDPEDVRAAIIAENVKSLTAVKGLGPKTAKRMIVELKDKLLKEAGDSSPILDAAQNNQGKQALREEAIAALTALGFSRIAVQKTISQILKTNSRIDKVETLVKLALKALTSA
ncbi:MAG: Holliday junction branch migration protein RuvA [Bacteroidota bacterium]